MVRRIDVTGVTTGYWGAVDELMAKQMYDGTFEPTLVVCHWDEETPAVDIGVHEDADMVDVDLARERGYAVGRRYAFGGTTAIHTPEIPNFMLYYRKENTSILEETDRSGEANVAGLNRLGLNAEYDYGDTEVILDGVRRKVIAGGGTTLHLPNYWQATASLIWDLPAEGEILNEAVSLPPEKFEDKDTDSATTRMQPISAVLEEAGQEASREDVIDAVVEENVKELLGEDEPIEQESWRPEEATYLSELAQFFESDPWINRRSTARMCQRAPSEFDVGVAAYKSRKLIKASVILDNAGTIHDALITSDMYIRPNPTITTSGALTDIGDAVVGLDPEDTEALKEAIASVLNQPGYEAPHIAPGDFARTISRAVENRQTVADYLE